MTPCPTPQKPTLREAFAQRVLLLDGAMGSLIQEYGYRGNYDELALTHPEVLHDVARRYLEAGADVITTCTFSAQRVSQAEYHLEDRVTDINRAAARIAIDEARRATAQDPTRPRYVLGDVGPTSKMLSMSDDVNDPAARAITFDELEAAYLEQITALIEEGVDGILVETIFDTLNAKAALSAFLKAREAASHPCEVLLSMTVSDASGRTLSGQTVEAFVASVLHARPLAVGLNCGLGADGMLPYLRQMSAVAPCYVTCHPNAGLPNQFGGYDDTPEQMVSMMRHYLDERLVNMMGGCCGTTPAHIAALRAMIDASALPKREPQPRTDLTLAGLEPFAPGKEFATVGERCNVAGSRKFLRLINEKNYDEALDIARRQVEDGARVIDINMDDGLLDAEQEMRTFINLLMSDPSISRVPLMVDSSRFEVIEAGLKCAQGKCIVNSISLKQGEAAFLDHARTVRRLGAAVIFMLFDEEGQATDYERRIRIAQRGYSLLVDEVGFEPSDIIIDPNVLTVATGMAEHNAYAADFIRATRWITENLPGVRVSGGLSNLSFAFRGNNYLREAMHSVFLHHATAQGMGMAIMNPASAVDYRTIPLELRMAITEVILNTYPEAPEELMEIAQRMNDAQQAAKAAGTKYDPKGIFEAPLVSPKKGEDGAVGDTQGGETSSTVSPAERLQQALVKGITTTVEADVLALIHDGQTPLQIISGPLMAGMNTVGQLFGEGKMFLPQVVKTARTMKKAVEVLNPFMTAGDATPDHADNAATIARPKVLLATVKGDVHDIGKNIVGVVLACNNFEVIDLGVMVPTERIIEEARAQAVDFVCLSGLITPSLEEMCHVAAAMQEAGMTMPLFVGGATTSAIHTAVKIAPLYDGGVFHLTDAAKNPVLAMQLMDPAQRDEVLRQNREQQEAIRARQSEKTPQAAPQAVATTDWSGYMPAAVPFAGQRVHAPIALRQLLPLIDWTYFYWPWRVKADSEEGRKLKADADELLARMMADGDRYDMRAITAFYDAKPLPEGALCVGGEQIATPSTAQGKALWHYVAPEGDHVGVFAATVSQTFIERLEAMKQDGNDDYAMLLMQTLGDVLVEAASEYLQRELEQTGWRGIRPAVGYPLLPDQHEIFHLARLIDYAAIGITLTENGAMYPQSSVSGLYIGHPEAEY